MIVPVVLGWVVYITEEFKSATERHAKKVVHLLLFHKLDGESNRYRFESVISCSMVVQESSIGKLDAKTLQRKE